MIWFPKQIYALNMPRSKSIENRTKYNTKQNKNQLSKNETSEFNWKHLFFVHILLALALRILHLIISKQAGNTLDY